MEKTHPLSWEYLRQFARLVKIEHSVFALPFAYAGMFMAARGWPGWRIFLLVTLAMVSIRSFAMSMNRLLDRTYDQLNPRTAGREILIESVGISSLVIFTILSALVFILAAYFIDPWLAQLGGPVLIWAGLYSLSKRFTSLTHLWLGSVLGLAPVAGWLAVEPIFRPEAVLIGLGVTFWVAGFDILYALQDTEFDRAQKLYSIPARIGIGPALFVSSLFHLVTMLFLILAGWVGDLGWFYFLVAALIAVIFFVEHSIVSENDLSRINMAFFTISGLVALLFCLGVVLDLFVFNQPIF